MKEKKLALQVSALCDGTVIDHIPADKLFEVVNLLKIQEMDTNVTIGFNLESKKLGKKGLIKIADRLHNVAKCNNPMCITNNEPMSTHFHLVDRKKGTLRCHYCDKEMNVRDIELL